jgi:hypothetical protein
MSFLIQFRPYPSVRLYDLKRFHASVNSIRAFSNLPPQSCSLCDQGGGGSALVPPGGGKGTDGLVVAGETVNTGLDENEAAASR